MNVVNPIQRKRIHKLRTTKPVSVTVMKAKTVSNGGTRVISKMDQRLCNIELSNNLIDTQKSVNRIINTLNRVDLEEIMKWA